MFDSHLEKVASNSFESSPLWQKKKWGCAFTTAVLVGNLLSSVWSMMLDFFNFVPHEKANHIGAFPTDDININGVNVR